MEESLTNEELMQIVKAVVAFNGGDIDFYRDYLKQLDHFDLEIKHKDEGIINLKTKFKGE